MKPELQARLDRLKDKVLPSDVIGRDVVLAKAGRQLEGLCPFHSERTPSFKVDDDNLNFRCWGCGVWGDIVTYAMKRYGLRFIEAVRRLEREGGLDGLAPTHEEAEEIRKRNAARRARVEQDEREHRLVAQRIFDQAMPLREGDAVDRYLKGRALLPPEDIDANGGWPVALRFAPELRHDFAHTWHPAMVAAIQRPTDEVVSVHRTYLEVHADGSVTKAQFERPRWAKMTYGFFAGMGAAIRLGPPASRMGCGEGIETSLSFRQLYGISTWSAVNSANMASVDLPFDCGELIFAADLDKNGVGVKRAWLGAARARKEARKATVRHPARAAGLGDYNAVLKAQRGFPVGDKERLVA